MPSFLAPSPSLLLPLRYPLSFLLTYPKQLMGLRIHRVPSPSYRLQLVRSAQESQADRGGGGGGGSRPVAEYIGAELFPSRGGEIGEEEEEIRRRILFLLPSLSAPQDHSRSFGVGKLLLLRVAVNKQAAAAAARGLSKIEGVQRSASGGEREKAGCWLH